MKILISISPFIVFFALMRLASPVAGLGGALVTSALLCLRMWRRRESVKILEVGSLVLFALLVAYTLVAAPAWTVATVRLAVVSGLLAIVLVSLAINRPFTLQYARERVPSEFWGSPVFLAVNRRISLVWAASFAVLVAADAAAEWIPSIPIQVDVVTSIAAFAAALWFTSWYPERIRRAFAV
jgi:hypothetical protein